MTQIHSDQCDNLSYHHNLVPEICIGIDLDVMKMGLSS
jgi:hypothetical protein